MSRKRSQQRSGGSPAPKPTPRAQLSRLSAGKRLAYGLLAAGLVLVTLEFGLALIGIRPVTTTRDPWVGFSRQLPLFVADNGPATQSIMVTAPNKLRFFNPQEFPQKKRPGTYRVFTVGGSTTFGRPYDDATSFTGWLRELLAVTAPNRTWEVINAGGISYASYRVALLMEELVRYEPDLFVVYSGHNEFLEQRTYHQVRDLPPAVQRLGLLAARTRTGALIQRGAERLRTRSAPEGEGFIRLESEVVTLLDQTVGPTAFHRDDNLREQILRHYRFNLARICDIARSVGAEIILVTPASNLRAATPFKSEPREGLAGEELSNWQEAYRAGLHAWTNSLPQVALVALDQAAMIDDRHAQLHFLRGHALYELGRWAEAKAAYERARDEDVCPLRAPAPIPQTVREIAADRAVPLIDFVVLQESHAEHGIPGAEVFLDHVHPTVDSHRLLALEILRTMKDQGTLGSLPEPAVVDEVTRDVLSRIDPDRHAAALANLSKVLGWAGKVHDAYRLAVQGVGMSSQQAGVQYQAGLCAQLLGRNDEAVYYYRRTVELDPTAALAHGNLGVALEDLGQLQQAVRHLELAIQHGDAADIERNRRNLDRVRQRLAQSGEAEP